MKRLIKLFVLVLVFGYIMPVFAMEHIALELVPVNEAATVDTEMFTYTEFTYASEVTGKNYGRFNFQSVTNKTSKQVPVSINLLLFNAEKKNIGFVSYCTESDYEGDYAQKKLNKNSSTPFYINVTEKYFTGENSSKDVAYYAVLDENPYCHVGGYDKYDGLTIEQIASGVIVTEEEDGKKSFSFDDDIISKLNSGLIITTVMSILIVIVSYAITGVILNALYKRMFITTSPLSYLPIANNYVAVKLAFGDKIAKIYVILLFLSIPLLLTGILGIIFFILSFVSGVAFIIDIVKLITKKYDLCYLEPYTTQNVATGGTFSLKHGTVPTEEVKEVYVPAITEDDMNDDQEPVDLSFDNNKTNDSFIETDSGGESFSFDVSDMSGINNNDSLIDDDEGVAPPSETDNTVENKADGNSDLMNLFK